MTAFGDRRTFSIELTPVSPSWKLPASSMDRGPWSGLTLHLRGRCLTRVSEDGHTLRDMIYLPLWPVANWLVENIRSIAYEESNVHVHSDINLHDALSRWNESETPPGYDEGSWEDRRYEWYCRHFWLAGAEGCMLPDLAFVRADDRLWMSWSKPEFSGPRRLEFVEAPGFDFVEWHSAWEVFDSFTAYVAKELRGRDLVDGPWIKQAKPLEQAVRCTAAQFLRLAALDPGDLLEKLGIPKEIPAEKSIALQALRDLEISRSTLEETSQALEKLERPNGDNQPPCHLEVLRKLLVKSRDLKPEKEGYDAARWLRAHWGLNGEPMDDQIFQQKLSPLARFYSIPAVSLRNYSVLGSREDRGGTIVLFEHSRLKHPWAKRMELARALGHLLLDPVTSEGILGAGSSQGAQGPRRRRSGAFAAELLLPRSGLEELLQGRNPGDGKVFEDIMTHFAVGAQTAAYQLYNQGLLNFDDRDALIAEYGAYP